MDSWLAPRRPRGPAFALQHGPAGPARRLPPVWAACRRETRTVAPHVDGTFIWTASHDQRQCSSCTVFFTVAIAVCPQPRSTWSARSEARTNDLDGGQNVGGQLGLPAGGREEGAAITEGDRTPLSRCAVVPRRWPSTCSY